MSAEGGIQVIGWKIDIGEPRHHEKPWPAFFNNSGENMRMKRWGNLYHFLGNQCR